MKLGCAPFLATQVRGDTAWVGLLYVPAEMRRRGLGRAMFERWARTIPPDVRHIKLLAVNLDGEYPTGFWRKLGFEPADDECGELEIATGYMVRPAPRWCGSPDPPAAAA